MRLDTTRLNAEKYRRSHCERLGMEHQCVGNALRYRHGRKE